MIADNFEAGAVHGKVVGRLVRLLRHLLGRCAPLLVQGALRQVAELHVGMVGGGVQARHHLDHVVAAWDEAAISRHTAINEFCCQRQKTTYVGPFKSQILKNIFFMPIQIACHVLNLWLLC
jgi:hypothetical protein